MICFGCGSKIRWWSYTRVVITGLSSRKAHHTRCNDAFWKGHKLGKDSARGWAEPDRAEAVKILRQIISAYLRPTSTAEREALRAIEVLK